MNGEAHKPLVEVGWLLQNQFSEVQRRALDRARERVLEHLQSAFGQFDWRLPVIERLEPTPRSVEEPVELLDEGVHQRDARRLDFVLVLTAADLRSYRKSFALATPSRALGVAALSLARLRSRSPDDVYERSEHEANEDSDRVVNRLTALVLHCLADMTGVPHRDDPMAYVFSPESVDDLDTMSSFSDTDREHMSAELSEVADPRVEEESATTGRRGKVGFYLRAIRVGHEEILASILRAAPWQFPLRLSRLSTAALSALLVLMLTEETWAVGTDQPAWLVVSMSLLTIAATSGYILRRQQLLMARGKGRLTEQNVVTQTAIVVVVLIGMATTYIALWLLVFALAVFVFGQTAREDWSLQLSLLAYSKLAGFVATIGVLIGALGASFEGQAYFRHLTYVDEET